MSEKVIEIRHLQKSFGENVVLKDIDFSISKGETVSVIGSSGSGKSTMLRCVNLLETPTGGEILFHGKNIQTDLDVSKYRASVGMVFQSFNLFDNLNALQNCLSISCVSCSCNIFRMIKIFYIKILTGITIC